jgi:hypothetical protein
MTYRAFEFQSYVAPSLTDPEHEVLKLDYRLEQNPALVVRRVVDELVQVADDFYLGRAHLQWWWGKWQALAFFTLTRGEV